MHPDAGRMEPLRTEKEAQEFSELFSLKEKEAIDAFNSAKLEQCSEIEKELNKQRVEGSRPIFKVGEIVPIRGGAFRVTSIKPNKITIKPVKDADVPLHVAREKE